jgi:formylglycine-generating enzyme required for sulfatase activity
MPLILPDMVGGIAKLSCFGNDRARAGISSNLKMALNKPDSHFSGCMGAASRIRPNAAYASVSAGARGHRHLLAMKPFYIGRYPVTNAEFKKFVDAAGYRPKDDHNFLKDWRGGTFPEGWADKPVIWVSLEEARAYAAWAGRRLPHEWEWQYAAQGADGRLYPWGTRGTNALSRRPTRAAIYPGPRM